MPHQATCHDDLSRPLVATEPLGDLSRQSRQAMPEDGSRQAEPEAGSEATTFRSRDSSRRSR